MTRFHGLLRRAVKSCYLLRKISLQPLRGTKSYHPVFLAQFRFADLLPTAVLLTNLSLLVPTRLSFIKEQLPLAIIYFIPAFFRATV